MAAITFDPPRVLLGERSLGVGSGFVAYGERDVDDEIGGETRIKSKLKSRTGASCRDCVSISDIQF